MLKHHTEPLDLRGCCLQRGEGTEGEKNASAKKKWFEEKQKRKHTELERLGLDTTETHRIESAEQVRIASLQSAMQSLARLTYC